MIQIKILILGATGMLGHVLFSRYLERNDIDVYGTVRSTESVDKGLAMELGEKLLPGVHADDFDTIVQAIEKVKPDVVVNCIGLVGKFSNSDDVLKAITINAMLPHRISLACKAAGIRMIHISTDGVFDGRKGGYSETDEVNISDIYGMTKYLGEVRGPACLTIRTSIIGHEVKKKSGLLEWFLSRTEKVKGYKNAIYSGFPTIELANIIGDHILPNGNLAGICHVSSEPVSKYELLRLVAERYGRDIPIEPSEEVVIDRSLDSTVFRSLTGYCPPSWPELVNEMFLHYRNHKGNMYV